MSSGLTLTKLVPVSVPDPLPLPASTSPTVFPDSEVEPQIAVDPRPGHTTHAVAIWQQDRFRSEKVQQGLQDLEIDPQLKVDSSAAAPALPTPAYSARGSRATSSSPACKRCISWAKSTGGARSGVRHRPCQRFSGTALTSF
jgi:hypothetical protein